MQEFNKQRDFSVQLTNNSYSKLTAGKHTVKLLVYDTTDFEARMPIASQTISDAESIELLNDSMLPLNITLNAEAFKGILGEDGEIPEGGAWIFFRAVLMENSVVIDDADIGNDMDYVKVYSLIERNGTPFSISKAINTSDGKTTVNIGAMNNSMNDISNGNIIVTLRDESGNILATQQTYNPSDAPGSLISVAGENSCAASFLFEQPGYAADTMFSTVSNVGTKLSVLNISGVQYDFNKDVTLYDLEVLGLKETSITAVAENPDSVVTITKNGLPLSQSERCELSDGVNTFVITVTTGEHEVVYTINITKTPYDDEPLPPTSTDASLTSLSVDKGSLIFDAKTLIYSNVEVPYGTETVTVSFETAEGATTDIESPASVTIADGAGSVSIVVTAQDNLTTQTYTIIFKEGSKEDQQEDPQEEPQEDPQEDPLGDEKGTTNSYAVSIDGISQRLYIRTKENKAIINLGEHSDKVFAGNENAVMNIPPIPGVDSYTLELKASTLADPYGKASLTVNTELGSMTIPSGMLAGMKGLEGKAAGISISASSSANLPDDVRTAIGDRPVIELTLTLDGVRTGWNNPEAPVRVSIPYIPTPDEILSPESIVVWYIDGSGRAVCIPNGRYDSNTGTVTFSTTHFSFFAVAYNKVTFNDVSRDAWFSKAVGFISARGITKGTGGGKYSPQSKLTRGEFLVLLMNAYGIAADENPEINFSDAGNIYYTGYLAAAKRIGIAAGVGNNRFAPGNEITRQEMFTFLYNTLKAINSLPQCDSTGTLSDFSDAAQVDLWAKDAVELLVEAGTIAGSAGKLNPKDTATRAEIAQMIYNLLSN